MKVNIKYVKSELNSEYWYNICGFIKLINRIIDKLYSLLKLVFKLLYIYFIILGI